MITVTSILAPLANSTAMSFHPVYLLMAIAAGSLIGTWMNDSGFWLFRTMTGLSEIETLKTKTTVQIVLGVSAFLVAVLASWLLPLTGVPAVDGRLTTQ
jgi:GntP family gluconate:H+ symporter